MKLKLLFYILFLSFKTLQAQDGENPLPFVMQEPKFDTAPRYPGGSAAMMKYFEDSVRYPEPEKAKRLQGFVSLKFEVTVAGKATNVQLLNGVQGAPNLAKEAVRLIYDMPVWIPASKNGKPVQAAYYLSVPFKL